MPIDMQFGSWGEKLLATFELGPGAKPAEIAYQCPAKVWTIWVGITHWEDGSPVRRGDTCTPERGAKLMAHHLAKFVAHVNAVIDVPLTQNQFDVLVSRAFNLGSLPRPIIDLVNSGQMTRAVEKFQEYQGYTSRAPGKEDFDSAEAMQKTARIGGKLRWVGPDGEPCGYLQRSEGLLRRLLSESCLWLDLHWEEACRRKNIRIDPTPPSAAKWDASWRDDGLGLKGRWVDHVVSQTRLSDVLPTAQRYPLAAMVDEDDWLIDAQPMDGEDDELVLDTEVALEVPDAEIVLPEFEPPPISTGEEKGAPGPAQLPPAPPIPKAPPPPLPKSIGVSDAGSWDPGIKDMFTSKRFYGGALIIAGRLIITLNVAGAATPVVGVLLGDAVLMDWTTGILAWFGGEALRHWGEKTATKPLGTGKEVALATPPPAAPEVVPVA